MRRQLYIVLVLLLTVSARATAQLPVKPTPPLDATVCDLMAEPSKYNGQLVRVRGQISIAFEDFSLFDKACPRFSGKDRALGVWLEYGGDESTPTVYCCGDHSRKPGEVLKLQGHPIPLLRDPQLLEFRKRISAARQARPDGQPCYDRECYFYDVTATLTGHFFAAQVTKESISAYGHLGCCHLLFIEQVTQVDGRRTEVPAGGIFDCKQEEWTATGAEIDDALADYKKCNDAQCFEKADKLILTIGAKHFGESLEQLKQWREGTGNEEAESRWSSTDLLTTLNFKFPYTNPNIHTSRKDLVISRTRCSVLTTPLPRSKKTNCETHYWSAESPESKAESAQRAVGAGSDLWRLNVQKVAWSAVQDYAARNSIALSSNLVFKSCDENKFQKDSYADCSWTSRDGMQTVWVNLIRYGALNSRDRPKGKTAWELRSGTITNCKVE